MTTGPITAKQFQALIDDLLNKLRPARSATDDLSWTQPVVHLVEAVLMDLPPAQREALMREMTTLDFTGSVRLDIGALHADGGIH